MMKTLFGKAGHLITPFFLIILFSCHSGKVAQQQDELCVGNYLTEEEAAQKLKEYAQLYHTSGEWQQRAARIRKNIRTGSGLLEIPDSCWQRPVRVIRGQKHQLDGYTVENIALEPFQGYLITGNLYQPDSVNGKIPLVLCPHGHWFKPEDYGRFRPDMQKRCASFARMGAMAFAWDMYGAGEDVGHVHHSPDALTWQCFNGIRILDFFSGMETVDTNRIAITGASGGGTQTFLIAALDPRIDVSVPVVMVSAHFFGGCVCESGKPIHKHGDFETNNVEIAASIAPKPLMLVGDGDDWTRNLPKVEFPYILNIYRLFGAEDQVEYAFFPDEKHDYGFSKRKAVYPFLAKHLQLDVSKITNTRGEIDESFVTLLDTTALKVFPDRSIVRVR